MDKIFVFTLFLVLILAPLLQSSSATSKRPYFADVNSGVNPFYHTNIKTQRQQINLMLKGSIGVFYTKNVESTTT